MASNYGGYMGRVITIDLTTETVTEYPWSDRQRERTIGGKIMALSILAEMLSGSEKAFSEETPVVISTGPLTGTGAPSSVRFDITSLSPQNDLPSSSNCGGSFGLYLKKAGYDAMILTGRCKERRWLEIIENDIIFHDAASLWGSKTGMCQQMLSEELGTKQFGRLCIGPAGENLVTYAAVVGDNRAAGRSGIGAVLGWKNLKAITVRGSKNVPLNNSEKVRKLNKAWFSYLKNHPLTGGPSSPAGSGCIGCPISCGKQGKDDKAIALEALCPKGSPMPDWGHLLNELGMDTIASADAIHWALEAGEQGVINTPISIRSADDLARILEDIALCRGFGGELARGEKWLSKTYGYQSSKKGGHGGHRRSAGHQLILEAYGLADAQQSSSLTMDAAILFFDLTEAISSFGQCMFSCNACCPPVLLSNPGSIWTKWTKAIMPHLDWAIHLVTKHPRMIAWHLSFLHHLQMLQYVTGMKMSFGRCIEVGRRGHTLEQLLRHRFGRKGATLPKSLPKDKTTSQRYCTTRGWDESGLPTEKSLKQLKLIP